MTTLPKSVAHGTWSLNDMGMDVLDDGQRVIGNRDGVLALVVGPTTGNADDSGGHKNGDLMTRIARIPGVLPALLLVPSVAFKRGNATVQGRPATWFVSVCEAYVDALRRGALHPKQVPIALNAAMLLGALARVGVVALVDEVTGYQMARPGDALQTEIEKFFRADPCLWDRMWEPEVVQLICVLYRRPWDGIGREPRWVRSPMDKIYRTVFGPALHREMKAISPSPEESDVRRHQHWTDEVRETFRRDHMTTIVTLLKASDTVEQFWERLESHYGRRMRQIDMALPDAPAAE